MTLRDFEKYRRQTAEDLGHSRSFVASLAYCPSCGLGLLAYEVETARIQMRQCHKADNCPFCGLPLARLRDELQKVGRNQHARSARGLQKRRRDAACIAKIQAKQSLKVRKARSLGKHWPGSPSMK